MRKFAIVLILCAGAAFVIYRRDTIFTHWEAYKAPDASFSVELPGEPKVLDNQNPLIPTVHSVNAVVKQDTVYSCLYVVSHELSESEADGLKDADRAFVPMVGMTPVSDRQFKFDGHPAREMHLRGHDTTGMDVRFLAVGDRLYVLTVTGPDENRNLDMIHRFFDSLKVAA